MDLVRRSSRQVKKPEFYTIKNQNKKLNVIHEDIDNNEENSDIDGNEEINEDNLVNNEEDMHTDEEDDIVFDSNVKKTKTSIKRKANKSIDLETKTPSQNFRKRVKPLISKDLASLSLFDALVSIDHKWKINPKSTEITIALTTIVDHWINSSKSERSVSMVNIVNFVLMSAGASKEWIPLDVDLDALEPNEINDLVSDLIIELTEIPKNDYSSGYPLLELSKNSNKGFNIRTTYILFWEMLSDRLLSSLYNNTNVTISKIKGRGSSYDILNLLVDQLIAFSSLQVVNIRDAVTEALLTIGNQIISNSLILNEQILSFTKQMSNESQNSQSNTQSKSNRSAKYDAYFKQKDQISKILVEINKVTSNIFNSIIVHRIKDSQQSVRLVCIKHLTAWIIKDSNTYFKDEYLKYIGWLLFDISPTIRIEAIKSINKLTLLINENTSKDISSNLYHFIIRFTERFIEIASSDIDDNVALEMMQLFRKLQSKGLTDHINEEQLDIVDRVVFDNHASLKLRQESLLFLMDHTQGFEVILSTSSDTEQPISKSKLKSTKKSIDRNFTKNYDSLIETLAEFVEHHIISNNNYTELTSEQMNRIDMLADACLSIPNCDLLVTWESYLSLLLKDFDDSISSTIRPALIPIIFRLLARSINFIFDQINRSNAQVNTSIASKRSTIGIKSADDSLLSILSHKNKRVTFNTSQAVSNDSIVHIYESMNSIMTNSVNDLLIRYRDNTQLVTFTCDIILLCTNIVVENNYKIFKKTLKQLKELYLNSSSTGLYNNIIQIYKSWLELSYNNQVYKIYDEIVNDIRELFIIVYKNLKEAMEEYKHGSAKLKSKRKSRGQEMKDSDILNSIAILSEKLKNLWMIYDCRLFITDSLEAVVDDLVEVSDTLITKYDEIEDVNKTIDYDKLDLIDDSLNTTSDRLIFDSCHNATYMILIVIAWLMYDLFELMKQISNKINNNTEISSDLLNDLNNKITVILSYREKLVDVITAWMSYHYNDKISDSIQIKQLYHLLKRDGFTFINEIRLLFPLSLNDYMYLDKLSFECSNDVLNYMRYVYDSEGAYIMNQLRSDINNKLSDKLCDILLSSCIEPLSKPLIYDSIENINRRQAASIINYLIYDSTNDKVSNYVKKFIKYIKSSNFIKYIEIILITTKGFYQDNISISLTTELDNTLSNINNSLTKKQLGDETMELSTVISNQSINISKYIQLSKRLCNSIGVGKLKERNQLITLVNFIKAGIDYSFSHIANLIYLNTLHYYFKYLTNHFITDISSYFAKVLANHNDNVIDIIIDLPNKLQIFIQSIVLFQSHLPNQSMIKSINTNIANIFKTIDNKVSCKKDYENDIEDDDFNVDDYFNESTKPKGKNKKDNKSKKLSDKDKYIDIVDTSKDSILNDFTKNKSTRSSDRVAKSSKTISYKEDSREIIGEDDNVFFLTQEEEISSKIVIPPNPPSKQKKSNKMEMISQDSAINVDIINDTTSIDTAKNNDKIGNILIEKKKKESKLNDNNSNNKTDVALGLELEDFDDVVMTADIDDYNNDLLSQKTNDSINTNTFNNILKNKASLKPTTAMSKVNKSKANVKTKELSIEEDMEIDDIIDSYNNDQDKANVSNNSDDMDVILSSLPKRRLLR